jgi:5-methylcytosine-specific restriction endonuclease McrA
MSRKKPSYFKRFASKIAARDGGYFCRYCGIQLTQPGGEVGYSPIYVGGETYWTVADGYGYGTIDHVIPQVDGGTDDLSNLVLACSDCNCSKRTQSLDAWNAKRGVS